jgi:hypothetical protein
MTCMTAATAGQGKWRLGTWLRRRRAGVHAKETKTETPSPRFEAVSWAGWAGLGRLGRLRPTGGPASSLSVYFFCLLYFSFSNFLFCILLMELQFCLQVLNLGLLIKLSRNLLTLFNYAMNVFICISIKNSDGICEGID